MKRRTFLGTALALAAGPPLFAAPPRRRCDDPAVVAARAADGIRRTGHAHAPRFRAGRPVPVLEYGDLARRPDRGTHQRVGHSDARRPHGFSAPGHETLGPGSRTVQAGRDGLLPNGR